MIVDDSALVRRALSESLSRSAEIEVVGTATDPYAARTKILELKPDVLTLDVEMPRMDGITFLKLLMERRPMPVIVLSSLTGAGSATALEALNAGAVEVLEKPHGAFSAFEDHQRLVEVVKAAAGAKVRTHASAPARPAGGAGLTKPPPPIMLGQARKIILMGASTGGTQALQSILTRLPAAMPGICIVQHIPAQFSAAFAQRLNKICALEVREAKNGDLVVPGLALIAPGGFHMVLQPRGDGYEVRLNEGPRIHYQRPAVDVLFGSAVKAGAAKRALAVLLTGMGADGAAAMLELKNAGARTIAQDESTCVVFGMPREAIRLGAAEVVSPLGEIPGKMEQFATHQISRPAEAVSR